MERTLVPKKLRDDLGLQASTTVDVSRYCTGLQIVPARPQSDCGVPFVHSSTEIDVVVFGLIDAGRR